MEDLGRPIAYLALDEGTPVFDHTGARVGVVERVVADLPMDIFEGLIIQEMPLFGRHLFADADQIAELHERGALLSVGREDLREYSETAVAKRNRASSRRTGEGRFRALLRHAWHWISTRS
ncbi:PRC-barrel domain containing protein [Saccharopolyspora phatthalungensis]|uniref:Uncharacterized protein YrrD n=1 Tax=Saccharopolyspora phatthalungensis TaxID=664693 RepID=A0A840QD30_9PSEU|nr:PRC-barrel domain containing protein [Saccharopolyspora phatthalungensis]MBB5158664.1 uncharacterized protein YrrD [Saccharopolyspora phatthalungensis]